MLGDKQGCVGMVENGADKGDTSDFRDGRESQHEQHYDDDEHTAAEVDARTLLRPQLPSGHDGDQLVDEGRSKQDGGKDRDVCFASFKGERPIQLEDPRGHMAEDLGRSAHCANKDVEDRRHHLACQRLGEEEGKGRAHHERNVAPTDVDGFQGFQAARDTDLRGSRRT